MFTGIVAAIGRIESIEALDDPAGSAAAGVRLTIEAGSLGLADVAIGDSIAIQGACMTAVSIDGNRFVVEVSRESLSKTAGLDRIGEVNLEKALRLADRLGGHAANIDLEVQGLPKGVTFTPTSTVSQWAEMQTIALGTAKLDPSCWRNVRDAPDSRARLGAPWETNSVGITSQSYQNSGRGTGRRWLLSRTGT